MGRMGQALADRLLTHGHEVTIWNRTHGKAPGLPLTSTARDLYQRAVSRSATADIASVTELYRNQE